ncbi:MAG: TolC family protein [Bacteriovorax sp.]|jgi:outer membrane protein
MKERFLNCLVLLAQTLYFNDCFAITLKESFESALRTNQSENINQSVINQTVEQTKQNKANYLPKLSARGTYFKQDNVNVDQKTYGLNLAHTLYRGGRDSYLVDTAEKNTTIAENQKIADQLDLYLSVIQAYYNYFLNLNDYKNLELLKKQSMERVEETRKRVQVGRSRKGELLQAEAQLAGADAQLFNGLGLVKESEERFYILTGLDKTNNSFSEVIQVPSGNKNLQFYLDEAFQRSDVKNRQLLVEQADIEISSSKSQYLPTLDLASNYYFNERNSSSFRDSKWDVGLTLNIPLFEGGTTSSQVRESVQKKEEAIYTLSDYKRSVQIDITSKYEIFHRFLDQVKAFDLALDKAKNSYDVAIGDYRLGLISNLDLLSSLNLYLDSKRNSEKTKIQAMMNLKILEASSGVLP